MHAQGLLLNCGGQACKRLRHGRPLLKGYLTENMPFCSKTADNTLL